MKTIPSLLRRAGPQRLQAPAAILIALLQRGPIASMIQSAEQILSEPPNAVFLKAAVASAVSLGAVQTLAGATTYSLVTTQSSPLTVTLNAQMTPVGFTVTNTMSIGTWNIDGQIPPGLEFTAVEGGNTLTGPGTLDATTPGMDDGYGGTTGGNSQTTPVLSGTPTQAGTYNISLTAYEYAGQGNLSSPTYTFTVNVTSPTPPPSFTTQPQGQSASVGGSVTLAATASNATGYQWQLNGAAIQGATNSTLTLTNIATTQAGSYTVVASDSAGSATSAVAAVTVGPPPSITIQPQGQTTVSAGASPTLSVAASPATSYQWQLNGTNIPGATNSTLKLTNIGTTQAGSYKAVVTGPGGTVTSSAATMAVNVGAYLYNISSLAYLGSGPDQNIVAGFYTNGAGSKNVVVCGVGPDLAVVQPALSGLTLTNPKLTMFNGSAATVATNTAWGGGPALVSALASVYSPPLPPSSNDTVVFPDVPAGPGIGYTAEVDSANNGTGLAQVEVFDYDAYTTGTPTAHLINISTRAFVGTGNKSLVAGFWTIGNTSETVLIRAVGPGLAVSNPALKGLTLVTPTLTLFDPSGNVIASSKGWSNAPVAGSSTVAAGIQPATAAIISSVYASTLAPGSTDCAMVVTLPPNSGYTAQVSSADSTTGIALVEVYDVPTP